MNLKHHGLFIALAGFWVGAAVVRSQERPAPNLYAQAVVREVLATGYPAVDRKQVLELTRYTIFPKARLPAHSHPGMQIERVMEGVLTYTVVSGAAQLMRKDGSELFLEEGKTTELKPGDSLVETAGMVHFAENKGEVAVVLLSSSLFETGRPKAIL